MINTIGRSGQNFVGQSDQILPVNTLPYPLCADAYRRFPPQTYETRYISPSIGQQHLLPGNPSGYPVGDGIFSGERGAAGNLYPQRPYPPEGTVKPNTEYIIGFGALGRTLDMTFVVGGPFLRPQVSRPVRGY